MATFGQLSTDPKQAQLLPLGAPEPTGGALCKVLKCFYRSAHPVHISHSSYSRSCGSYLDPFQCERFPLGVASLDHYFAQFSCYQWRYSCSVTTHPFAI